MYMWKTDRSQKTQRHKKDWLWDIHCNIIENNLLSYKFASMKDNGTFSHFELDYIQYIAPQETFWKVKALHISYKQYLFIIYGKDCCEIIRILVAQFSWYFLGRPLPRIYILLENKFWKIWFTYTEIENQHIYKITCL